MKYYVAPLEGITGYIFRNAFNDYFGEGVSKYYTPFMVPHVKRAFNHKELAGIIPEHNKGINLVPQVLTNDVEDFTRFAGYLRELGYDEVNINLGCPSRTVTSKGRGAGALADVEALDKFLDGVFASGDENISIKTRIGIDDPDEFGDILNVYKKYPIAELTIHPRVMSEQYKGCVHYDVFADAVKSYGRPICYNGDIFSVEDYMRLVDKLSNDGIDVPAVMLGRGILKNPSLIRELSGGMPFASKELYDFLNRVREDYEREFSGETPVLFKLKELWSYLGSSYADREREVKKIIKSKSLQEYDTYVKAILV